MEAHFSLADGRTVIIFSLDESSRAVLESPFATLLPAFNEWERRQAERIADLLIDRGSVEFCCVGPEAELLHDSIDEIIENKAALQVVTTWHTDSFDASEYFLFAAGGRVHTLLALVADHPALVALLKKEAQSG